MAEASPGRLLDRQLPAPAPGVAWDTHLGLGLISRGSSGPCGVDLPLKAGVLSCGCQGSLELEGLGSRDHGQAESPGKRGRGGPQDKGH